MFNTVNNFVLLTDRDGQRLIINANDISSVTTYNVTTAGKSLITIRGLGQIVVKEPVIEIYEKIK